MTLKDKIRLFEKFASQHEVEFRRFTLSGEPLYEYCNWMNCRFCCIRDICNENPQTTSLTKDEMGIIREKYPEYFI